MKKDFLHFSGVYGEQEIPFWDTAVYIEPIKKRSEVYNFEINEHLHSDLIQIFILEEGGGYISSEGGNIALEVPCVVFIPRGVLHGFSWHSNIKGSVITISQSYLEECMQHAKAISHHFQSFQIYAYQNEKDNFKLAMSNLSELIEELQSQHPHKKKMISLIITKLLIRLQRKGLKGIGEPILNENKMLSYFATFLQEVSKDTKRSKSIQEHAQNLNITAVHLNRVCQAMVQKSALQIIHEKLIVNAKNYLLHTDLTVREVSYSLTSKTLLTSVNFLKKWKV